MTASQRIIEFLLDLAIEEPDFRKRAVLYRDLAELVVDERAARGLKQMAAEIDASDRRQQQFMLDFKRQP